MLRSSQCQIPNAPDSGGSIDFLRILHNTRTSKNGCFNSVSHMDNGYMNLIKIPIHSKRGVLEGVVRGVVFALQNGDLGL